MLFATNRVLNEGPTPKQEDGSFALPRSISFALRDNQAEQSVYFCRRNQTNDYIEIGSTAFFRELKNAPCKQILIYIHGFNNLPEENIFPQAENLQTLFDMVLPETVLVVPLIWPCDDDIELILLDDYYDDQQAADDSAGAFARMFEKFMAWRETESTRNTPCTKWINILAHSMGNRVLRGTLDRAVRYFHPRGLPLLFRNTFMVAADVINETLEENHPGIHITESSRNVVVYYAADDLALRASKVANISMASRRLGHTGPERLDRVAKNVYALDCGDFNNDYDHPLGHTYFVQDPNGQPGLMFEHLVQCIQTGRVPLEDPLLRQQILSTRFW